MNVTDWQIDEWIDVGTNIRTDDGHHMISNAPLASSAQQTTEKSKSNDIYKIMLTHDGNRPSTIL